jgi:hypothetical protein
MNTDPRDIHLLDIIPIFVMMGASNDRILCRHSITGAIKDHSVAFIGSHAAMSKPADDE